MEVSGKIKFLNIDQKITETYTKSDVVITTDEQYPQHIFIEFGGQKSDLLDQCKIGDNVNISINIRGREWTNPQGDVKYFNSIQGWRVEKLDVQNPPSQVKSEEFKPHKTNVNDDVNDDLPF